MHTDASPAARRDLKHRARRSHFDALVRAPRGLGGLCVAQSTYAYSASPVIVLHYTRAGVSDTCCTLLPTAEATKLMHKHKQYHALNMPHAGHGRVVGGTAKPNQAPPPALGTHYATMLAAFRTMSTVQLQMRGGTVARQHCTRGVSIFWTQAEEKTSETR